MNLICRNFKLKNLLIILVALTFLFSCSKENKYNANFEKKYKDQVDLINKQRRSPLIENAPQANKVINVTEKDYTQYVDINQFDVPLKEYLPNREVYDNLSQANPSNSLPKNIFELSYNLGTHVPFSTKGQEFDLIEIPANDSYGIATNASEKEYLLASIESVQESIDLINSQRSESDIAISKSIIAETKDLIRKNKTKKILANDHEQNLANLEIDQQIKQENILKKNLNKKPKKSKQNIPRSS
jgi:hypothetical protein